MLDLLQAAKGELVILVQSVLALYIVVNPSGVASVFLGLTKSTNPGERRSIAFRAVLTGGLVLVAFALAGTYLFGLFRITAASLQIAGGIFVFGIAFALARGKEGEFFGARSEAQAEGAQASLAYYPLAVPMIASPASITIVVALSAKATDAHARVVLLASIGAVVFLCFLSMMRYVKLQERFGPGLALILPRIMGLILAVIAVQFILEGIEQVLPRLVEAAAAKR